MSKMIRVIGVLFFVVWGCVSKVDKDLQTIEPFEAKLTPKMNIDSLPKNADSMLFAFAQANPKHPKSENFCYYAVLIQERKNHGVKAAQWAEYYLQNFNGSKERKLESAVVASHYYEQNGIYDKALEYYKYLVEHYADTDIGKQAKTMVFFIEKGMVTPEQQLEYIQKMNDSAAIKPANP